VADRLTWAGRSGAFGTWCRDLKTLSQEPALPKIFPREFGASRTARRAFNLWNQERVLPLKIPGPRPKELPPWGWDTLTTLKTNAPSGTTPYIEPTHRREAPTPEHPRRHTRGSPLPRARRPLRHNLATLITSDRRTRKAQLHTGATCAHTNAGAPHATARPPTRAHNHNRSPNRALTSAHTITQPARAPQCAPSQRRASHCWQPTPRTGSNEPTLRTSTAHALHHTPAQRATIPLPSHYKQRASSRLEPESTPPSIDEGSRLSQRAYLSASPRRVEYDATCYERQPSTHHHPRTNPPASTRERAVLSIAEQLGCVA